MARQVIGHMMTPAHGMPCLDALGGTTMCVHRARNVVDIRMVL